MPAQIPGDKPISLLADLYVAHSKNSISFKIIGFFITPIALGNSGHKSLTSKTNNFPFIHRAKIPGIPAVNGVVEAKIISYLCVSATNSALKEYKINRYVRLK